MTHSAGGQVVTHSTRGQVVTQYRASCDTQCRGANCDTQCRGASLTHSTGGASQMTFVLVNFQLILKKKLSVRKFDTATVEFRKKLSPICVLSGK